MVDKLINKNGHTAMKLQFLLSANSLKYTSFIILQIIGCYFVHALKPHVYEFQQRPSNSLGTLGHLKKNIVRLVCNSGKRITLLRKLWQTFNENLNLKAI